MVTTILVAAVVEEEGQQEEELFALRQTSEREANLFLLLKGVPKPDSEHSRQVSNFPALLECLPTGCGGGDL